MALNKGEIAPNFIFTNREGNKQQFYDIKGKKIVFFFPKAFTAGCTAQACSLQDNLYSLNQEGITEVFGISIDTPEQIQQFKQEHNLDYIMIPDEDGIISKEYDVFNNFLLKKVSGRVTYIVDSDNKIKNTINSGIMGNKVNSDLSNHANEIINVLKL